MSECVKCGRSDCEHALSAEVARLRAALAEERRSFKIRDEQLTVARAETRRVEAEVELLTRERETCDGSCDIALARRQVGPDAFVPGNAKECAEAWEREAARVRAERDAAIRRVKEAERLLRDIIGIAKDGAEFKTLSLNEWWRRRIAFLEG